MATTLTVRNFAQKVLMELEIKGQLSDGMWENSNIANHWKPWCNAEVKIDAEKLGRDFCVDKDNYGLTKLISCIGNRMILLVRLSMYYGMENAELLQHCFNVFDNDFITFTGLPIYSGEYWDDVRAKISTFDMTRLAEVGLTQKYDKEQLKRDLQDLKKIFKIYKYSS